MHKHLCLAAIFVALTVPAFAADECGPTPIAPDMPTVADFGGKTVEAAHADLLAASRQIRTYQDALKTYRACLVQMVKADSEAIAAAKSKGEDTNVEAIKIRIADRNKINDKTVDNETQVAADFNALIKAQCDRGDPALKSCPKR